MGGLGPERLVANRGQLVTEDFLVVFLPDLLLELKRRTFQLSNHFRCGFHRCALGHGEYGHHVVCIDVREEDELDPAASDEARGDQQRRDADGNREIPPPEADLQTGLVDAIYEAIELHSQAVLQPAYSCGDPTGLRLFRHFRVSQMGRENQQGFHQREYERQDHDLRDEFHDLAHIPGHHQQG